MILETDGDAPTRIVAGTEAEAARPVPPASTFKIVLAWAGLEAGVVTPQTRHLCADRHVPGAPRELTLREAMFHSSNDYFVWLAGRLGRERLREAMERSGFFDKKLPEDWPGNDPRAVARGGDVAVTAGQEHRFILKVMRGELASSPDIQARLLECMAWPSPDPAARVHGKTGSYGGAAWFTGFAETGGTWKAVTVLLTGKGASRDEAIARFYRRWGWPPPTLARKGDNF